MAAYGELKCDLTSIIPNKYTDRCASYKKKLRLKESYAKRKVRHVFKKSSRNDSSVLFVIPFRPTA